MHLKWVVVWNSITIYTADDDFVTILNICVTYIYEINFIIVVYDKGT